jgi:acylphosphatase
MTDSKVAAHARVKGRVQGVGFRYFALEAANTRGVKGWVRNLPDGDVECVVEGSRPDVDDFLQALRQGPSMGRVDSVQVDWPPYFGSFSEFSIR